MIRAIVLAHDKPDIFLHTFLSEKKVLSSTKHRSFYGTVHIIDFSRSSDETNKQTNKRSCSWHHFQVQKWQSITSSILYWFHNPNLLNVREEEDSRDRDMPGSRCLGCLDRRQLSVVPAPQLVTRRAFFAAEIQAEETDSLSLHWKPTLSRLAEPYVSSWGVESSLEQDSLD